MVILTRSMLMSCALVGGFSPLAHSSCDAPFVKSVLAQTGGLDALTRVRELRWGGRATIHDQFEIHIHVNTTVTPFATASSKSWLITEDASKARIMLVEQHGGMLIRGGVESSMSEAMHRHERAQYAIYALMLLAPLCDREATLTENVAARSIVVAHPNAPTTTLFFDSAGHLIRASNSVPSPEGSGHIDQEFVFSSTSMPGAIHWPRTMQIRQQGKPYFDLTLEHFEAITQDEPRDARK